MNNVRMYKDLKRFYNYINKTIDYRAKRIDLYSLDIISIRFLIEAIKLEMPNILKSIYNSCSDEEKLIIEVSDED